MNLDQLKSHFRPRRVLVYFFTFLSLSSAAYISISASNYLLFYPAIGRIDFHVGLVNVHHDTSLNQTRLVAFFTVSNPSSYRGFVVRSFDLTVFFIHQTAQSNTTLFQTLPLVGSQPVDSPLSPFAEISSNVTILFYPDQFAPFRSFNNTYSNHIIAHASETVELVTFLDPVVGRIRLNNAEDIPLA